MIAFIALGVALTTPDSTLVFCCTPDNDLYRVVRATGAKCIQVDSVERAFAKAPYGAGILLLSDYRMGPKERLEFGKKHLRIYMEYMGPGDDGSSSTIDTEWERVIVTDGSFGPELPQGSILSLGRRKLRVLPGKNTALAVARVAGFDHLVFGIPSESTPLLWVPVDNSLVTNTHLSDFSTARFAPSKSWKPVISTILGFLGAPIVASKIKWEPAVRPIHGPTETLPKDIEMNTQRRAAAWFLKSHLLVDAVSEAQYNKADQWPDRVGPGPAANGNGSKGLLEGYSSAIDDKGNQPVRWYRRADCNAESAMALTQAGGPKEREVGIRLADFIALESGVLHNDPSKQSFGLVGWNDQPNNRGTFYGDDNARYILGLIGAAGAVKQNRWDGQILKCILANFRTTGIKGFRGDALSESAIEKSGWDHFFESPTVNMAPHFEAYMWALYLWAYDKTGYKPLLERARTAIEATMTAGENAWTWTNGLQQERARMLLPLSWLLRVDDTPVHRKWLSETVGKVLTFQDKCGAIREEIGDLSHGIAGPPRSNEAFGTAEAPLIQENGDPLADMLYTTNFAFLGLHEAACVTQDPALIQAENKLAEFLCRIQIRSETHPELDGAWFRAFDFGDWDYWASNSDLGWGAWSIESGWSVSWITTVLALRQHHVSFWDVHPSFQVDKSLMGSMVR